MNRGGQLQERDKEKDGSSSTVPLRVALMLLANGGALTDWDRQVSSADDCRKCHIDLFDTSTGGAAAQLLCVCVILLDGQISWHLSR